MGHSGFVLLCVELISNRVKFRSFRYLIVLSSGDIKFGLGFWLFRVEFYFSPNVSDKFSIFPVKLRILKLEIFAIELNPLIAE